MKSSDGFGNLLDFIVPSGTVQMLCKVGLAGCIYCRGLLPLCGGLAVVLIIIRVSG